MSYIYDPLSAVITSGVSSSPTYTYNSLTTGAAGMTGSAGSVLTSGTNGAAWATISASPNLSGQTLEVKGDANFTGEVTIKGKKLSEVLENIESRLAILHPNEKLEEKWENLRGLREAYVALEKEIIEKEAMWSILKR